MADLADGPESRGQLLIITAVTFAIVLIALALALNTAVYGNVHVSQTDGSSFEEQSATQYQESVRRGVTTLLPVVGNNETEANLRDRFAAEVALWENLTRSQYTRDGVATSVTVDNVTHKEWTVVQENQSRTFENRSGSSEWPVVSSVSENLTFNMTVQNDSLAFGENGSFALEAIGANGSSWTLSAFSTNDSEITVEINGYEEYASNESSVQIDLVNGTFDDTGGQTTFTSDTFVAALDSPYELRYENAGNVTGSYELVDDELEVDAENYNETGSPRVDTELRKATLTVGYQSPALTYRTEIHVFGGESDE